MQKKNRRFASEDIIAIEELAEQLASELNAGDLDFEDHGIEGADDDIVPIKEDGINADNDADVIAAAEQLLAELPDDEPEPVITGADNEAQQVLDEADKLEACIADREGKQEVLDAAAELESEIASCEDGTCPDCGKEKCECAKVASETEPGIEDEITDTVHGGDPSVSGIVDNDIECDTDKEVFGQNTDSEYVAKITARLDRVANALEKRGMKKMAFRVDQLSDRLESSIR